MILIVLLTLGFAPMVAGQPWQIYGTTGNYTANSTYQSNIESLQDILDPGGSISLFDKGSRGDVPDEVYTLVFCRSDVNDSACRACVADAFKGARQLCGLSRDATVFYDMCLLSYSNEDILGTDLNNRFNASENASAVVAGPLILMNITTEPMFPGWDTHDRVQAAIIDEVKQLLNETIQQMFTSTRQYYAATRKVTDHGNVTFPALYSMAQCTPDLVEDLCYACLKNFIGLATANFAGRQGGRILGLRCNLRYDTYQFYGGEPTSTTSGSLNSVVPSPAPPIVVPTQKYKKPMNKVLVIALVAPLLALFICVIVSFRFMRRHIKGKAKMNVHEGEELIWGLEGRSSEFMIYDFSQVLEATGNFSEENKLGQGGFGPVYKGRFPDGLEIAVKRLASHSGQGFTEFNDLHS
ncbi:cysteine-rich receptor-like protein kinase 10 isoform X1 [Phragmites australis]|uniref:cysteine-rich receptor-like protein kinase 10 isoform X1 n=1 Tax=Phragmites australis TaxID=29695 RepID=UPI002D79D9DE|nr:cysteine-rich receptor-like protein kinase 10 isoform X1 [Phragmites australis]